jgi:hypothetical protein
VRKNNPAIRADGGVLGMDNERLWAESDAELAVVTPGVRGIGCTGSLLATALLRA